MNNITNTVDTENAAPIRDLSARKACVLDKVFLIIKVK